MHYCRDDKQKETGSTPETFNLAINKQTNHPSTCSYQFAIIAMNKEVPATFLRGQPLEQRVKLTSNYDDCCASHLSSVMLHVYFFL